MNVDRESGIEQKRYLFFTRLAFGVRRELSVQSALGLFERRQIKNLPDGKARKTLERKHQAPEHMLVVMARSGILAEWLNLSPSTIEDLNRACALHDSFKAVERQITKRKGYTWNSFELSEKAERTVLTCLGVPKHLIELSQAAGHPINKAQKILEKKNLTEKEWAWVILHYVDMATSGIEGAVYDPIEYRLSRDEKFYTGFDNSAIGKIEGHPKETGFKAMRRTGKKAETTISEEVGRLHGITLDPKRLLLEVDEELKRRIGNIETPN